LCVESLPFLQNSVHLGGALEEQNSSVEFGKAGRNIAARITVKPIRIDVLFVSGCAVKPVQKAKQLRERLYHKDVGIDKHGSVVGGFLHQPGFVIKTVAGWLDRDEAQEQSRGIDDE
jgi:hypothetical protein